MPGSDSSSRDQHAEPSVVVLVDDDLAVLTSLTFALEMDGLSVKAYRKAADAVQDIDPPQAGCLVLDYLLPDTDGMTLLRKLRGMGITAPAIVITTNPSRQLRRDVREAGAAIVEKPLLGNALLDAVRAALNVTR